MRYPMLPFYLSLGTVALALGGVVLLASVALGAVNQPQAESPYKRDYSHQSRPSTTYSGEVVYEPQYINGYNVMDPDSPIYTWTPFSDYASTIVARFYLAQGWTKQQAKDAVFMLQADIRKHNRQSPFKVSIADYAIKLDLPRPHERASTQAAEAKREQEAQERREASERQLRSILEESGLKTDEIEQAVGWAKGK